MSYKEVKTCRICGFSDLFPYLELPDSPLCNRLNDSPKESNKYEVKVLVCKNCFLSQLSIVVDPEILYTSYTYHSSISNTFKNHCRDMARHLKNSLEFKDSKPTVLDIACNDGALLREFKKEGFITRGVEPCKQLANIARGWDLNSNPPMDGNDLIPIINDFFTEKVSKGGRSWSGEDVVTATNVFAHVDDVKDFLRACKYQIDKNVEGILVIEVPHLLSIFDHNQFDTIYHEHLSYFLVRPLLGLFAECGLEIFKVEKQEIHGGSIRIYASHPNAYSIDNSVEEIIKEEESGGMYDLKTYIDFSTWVYKCSQDINTVMRFTKDNAKKVMGYGASAKGISLVNYLNLGDYIHSIVDETPEKQGKFTPGANIPIVDFSHFEKEKPDYIVIFPWNFAEEMMEKTKHFGAKFIIPIPCAEIR